MRHLHCAVLFTRLSYQVPKEAHASVLKRGLTLEQIGLPADSALRGCDGGVMKEFLAQHGSWLCRPCHSAVHRFAGKLDSPATTLYPQLLVRQNANLIHVFTCFCCCGGGRKHDTGNGV
jgi:hypothetical protein